MTLFCQRHAGLLRKVLSGKSGQPEGGDPDTDRRESELEIMGESLVSLIDARHQDARISQGAKNKPKQHRIGRDVKIKIEKRMNYVRGRCAHGADVQGKGVAL